MHDNNPWEWWHQMGLYSHVLLRCGVGIGTVHTVHVVNGTYFSRIDIKFL